MIDRVLLGQCLIACAARQGTEAQVIEKAWSMYSTVCMEIMARENPRPIQADEEPNRGKPFTDYTFTRAEALVAESAALGVYDEKPDTES